MGGARKGWESYVIDNIQGKNRIYLYDTIADTGSDWLNTLDSRLDAEQFCSSLNSDQQDLIRMLQDGFTISEIMDILNISERDIRLMACEIARQRRKFDREL